MKTFFRQLAPAAIILAVFTFIGGVVYPMAVTAVAQVAFNDKANGSIIHRNGTAVGSSLIGQNFVSPRYFMSRPSAAGAGYDGTSSSGSNLGPNNPDFLKTVAERVSAYRALNGLSADATVPVDAVTASGSGLDPEISVANARLQMTRVARERMLSVEKVSALIDAHTEGRSLGVLGDPGVNVLELNLALDALR